MSPERTSMKRSAPPSCSWSPSYDAIASRSSLLGTILMSCCTRSGVSTLASSRRIATAMSLFVILKRDSEIKIACAFLPSMSVTSSFFSSFGAAAAAAAAAASSLGLGSAALNLASSSDKSTRAPLITSTLAPGAGSSGGRSSSVRLRHTLFSMVAAGSIDQWSARIGSDGLMTRFGASCGPEGGGGATATPGTGGAPPTPGGPRGGPVGGPDGGPVQKKKKELSWMRQGKHQEIVCCMRA